MRRAILAVVILALVLAGCSQQSSESGTESSSELPTPEVLTVSAPNPELAVTRFLSSWNEQDYSAMYAMLSPLTTDLITQEI